MRLSLPRPEILTQLDFWDEFRPPRLLASFTAGLLTGIIGAIRGISYAALIFSGSLSAYLNVGVGVAIYSTAAISIVVALLSSLPGMIATPLAAPTAVLAVLAAAIASRLSDSPPEVLLATVLAAIALGSLITGGFLWLLGYGKLGRALSVVPYPVVGGFMAGTGWLLVRGAIQVMTDCSLSFAHLPLLLQPAVSLHWLSGLGLALVLMVLTRRFPQFWLLPVVLLAALLSFYAALWLSGLSVVEARTAGWLLGPFPAGNLWQPLTGANWGQVEWGVIGEQAGTLATLAFISLLSLVMTNSGIELALERDLDLDIELQAVGLANLAAGLGSGMAGNQALPSTLLVHKMGAANRLSGMFKTLPCAAVLLLGSHLLAFFPKPILGGLLLLLGLDLLWQWVFKAALKLSRLDYGVIWLTLITINVAGFLTGIIAGLAAAVFLFVLDCARQDIAPVEFSAATLPTPTPRSPAQQQWCEQHAETLWGLQLQGCLFFGSAQRLLIRVSQQLASQSPRYLVLDCRYLTSFDTSTVLSFAKLLKLATQHELQVIFVGFSAAQLAQLQQGEIDFTAIAADNARVRHFAQWGEASTWCEQALLPPELKVVSLSTASDPVVESTVQSVVEVSTAEATVAGSAISSEFA
ncbi:MAG: SulP family inorganic anion transporter [Spirulinaceae cyanobacterium SM2_1_0]|nr:SulP family inorganic anion transporter [Spirulinaceae cyanobacterium SM2_1_0]